MRLVAVPLLVGQVDEQRLDPVIGQELPAELGDLAAIDDRADQVVEPLVGVVGALGGGGQARAGTGRSTPSAAAPTVGLGQVVALVEDEQAELVPEPVDVLIGRVVGRDRQRLDVVVAAAEQPDLDAEGERQLVVPLVHQVDRRRDDQARPLGLVDGEVGQVGLARARSAGRPRPCLPAFHQASSPSVWCGNACLTTRNGQGVLLVGAGLVAVRDLLLAEVARRSSR